MMHLTNTTLWFAVLLLWSTTSFSDPKAALDDDLVYPLMFVIGATGSDNSTNTQREDSDLRIYRDEFAFYPEFKSVNEFHQAKAASAWLLGRKLFSRPKVDIPLRLDSFQNTEEYNPCRDAKRYSLVRNDPLTIHCFGADGQPLPQNPAVEDDNPEWFLDFLPNNDAPENTGESESK